MNILKYYWNDVIIVLAVNYFLIDYKTTLLFFTIFALLSESTPDYILYFLLLLMLLTTIIRVVALPILYGYMEKHSKEAILLKFIHNLKHSWKWKIGILLITMISPIIFDFNYPERVQLILTHLHPVYLAYPALRKNKGFHMIFRLLLQLLLQYTYPD